MMRALVYDGPGRIDWTDVALPEMSGVRLHGLRLHRCVPRRPGGRQNAGQRMNTAGAPK